VPALPRRAIRDALGLARLLWSVAVDHADARRVTALTRAGSLLSAALAHQDPVEAHRLACEGTDALLAAMRGGDLGDVVRAGRARVVVGRPKAVDERDAKRAAVAKRG
jgi:hypothetical protein